MIFPTSVEVRTVLFFIALKNRSKNVSLAKKLELYR